MQRAQTKFLIVAFQNLAVVPRQSDDDSESEDETSECSDSDTSVPTLGPVTEHNFKTSTKRTKPAIEVLGADGV